LKPLGDRHSRLPAPEAFPTVAVSPRRRDGKSVQDPARRFLIGVSSSHEAREDKVAFMGHLSDGVIRQYACTFFVPPFVVSSVFAGFVGTWNE